MKPLTAKLTRPRVEGIAERDRLFDRLDRVVGEKIVWMSAPAGSGKTTLVASWLASRKLPCLWYQADEGDRDIAAFFSYLGLAVKHAAPRHRTPLPLFTPEYRLGMPTFTRRYFETLFSRLKPPFCVVIDNYQDVPADSQLHDVIRDGLSIAHGGISIVIISRTDPLPVFARLQANSRLEVIGRDEIWFTFEESLALVRSRGKEKTPETALTALYEKTQGWAAGLVLIAESGSLKGGFHELEHVPSERIFDYFASELFEGSDRETRHFLLTTAFLRTMTSRSARELSGDTRADKILTWLSRTNFFIERRAVPEVTYQYHPLFRQFLQHRAKDHFSPEDLQAIKKKAAVQLRKSGTPEEAARLLTELSDWQGLTELVLENGRSFIAQGRFLTIGTWIHSMPPGLVEQNGWLLYWKAMCRLATRPAEARAMLEKAYTLFRTGDDAAGSFLSWSGIVETFVYEWRNFRPLDHWIEEFAGLLRRYSGFPSGEVEERATSAIFTALMYHQPGHPDLRTWTDRVQTIMHRTGDLSHRMFIGYNLILYYLWTGRIIQAGTLVSTLSPVVKTGRSAHLPKLMWYRTESLYHLYAGHYATGLNTVEQGILFAEETGVHHLDMMFFGMGVYFSVMQGEVEQAKQFLGKMAASLGERGCFGEIFFAHQASLVALLSGDLDSAIQHGERCMERFREAEAPLIMSGHQYVLINILMETGRYDLMRLHIAELRNRGVLVGSMHFEAWCSAVEAVVALREGDDEAFAASFRQTAILSLKSGIRIVVFLRSTLSPLCAKALELGIESDFVKELIRLHHLAPERPSAAGEAWPWPIKIYTLGRFALFRDDKPAAFSGKVQKKPLELLKAIVAFGGRDVTEEKLIDALWSEAEGDAAERSFDTTLHRLRKLLADDDAVLVRDGQVSLNERRVWTDAGAFEQLLEKVEDMTRRNGDAEKRRKGNSPIPPFNVSPIHVLLERAISLYRGHFLPGDAAQPWALSLRERLRAKFLHCTNVLGSHWQKAGRYDQAARCYEKGLEIDHLAEELYQQLMTCHHKLGQEAEAVKIYHRCRTVLLKAFGIEPSTKTKEIYSSIRRNG